MAGLPPPRLAARLGACVVWSGRRQLAFCFPGLLASDATTAAPARTRRSPAADCHPLCTTGSSPSLAPTKRLQASNRIAPKSSETEARERTIFKNFSKNYLGHTPTV